MRILIIGAGEIGYTIAEQLIIEGKDVVLIEKDPEKAKYVSNHLDCMVLVGEGTNTDILKEAGIENADIFISVTNSDEVNMISCFIVANEFNVPLKLARVRNLEYSKTRMFTKTRIGIDFVVNPEFEAAKSIINTVEQGATSDVFSFEDMDIQFRDIFVDEESNLAGKKIKYVRSFADGDFLVAGILRENDVIIPHGDTIILNDDHIFAVGTKKTINQFMLKSGIKRKKLKKILIAGGGNIGSIVADILSFRGRKVTLVDKDYSVCKDLAEKYPDVTVLNGDISDSIFFEEEQLGDYDLVITTTSNEELNILSAIYAKTLGVTRAIALVNKHNFIKISKSLGIDATISPKLSSAGAILKFIRKGDVKGVNTIFDGKAEAIEFNISHSSYLAGKVLKELKLPDKTLIVAVLRDGKGVIPDGNFLIKPKDNVIIFANKESIAELEEKIIV